ncbi:protein of unknown function [Methylacidimicrobium sp. AP8]|nr:protein of unknown function [Methylacidimicrobium sp. AP8]
MRRAAKFGGAACRERACSSSMNTRVSLLTVLGRILAAASLLAVVACSEKPKPQPAQPTPAPTYQPLDHKS